MQVEYPFTPTLKLLFNFLLINTKERIKVKHFLQVVVGINEACSYGNITSVLNVHIKYQKPCFQLDEIYA